MKVLLKDIPSLLQTEGKKQQDKSYFTLKNSFTFKGVQIMTVV